MRIEIKELQKRLKCTSIYVTHDQAEAMVLGDRIILLDSGKVRQEGEPTELYQSPTLVFRLFLRRYEFDTGKGKICRIRIPKNSYRF